MSARRPPGSNTRWNSATAARPRNQWNDWAHTTRPTLPVASPVASAVPSPPVGGTRRIAQPGVGLDGDDTHAASREHPRRNTRARAHVGGRQVRRIAESVEDRLDRAGGIVRTVLNVVPGAITESAGRI